MFSLFHCYKFEYLTSIQFCKAIDIMESIVFVCGVQARLLDPPRSRKRFLERKENGGVD